MAADRKIRIWYRNKNQSSENPDPPGMYHMKEFSGSNDAHYWYFKNVESLSDAYITDGHVRFEHKLVYK